MQGSTISIARRHAALAAAVLTTLAGGAQAQNAPYSIGLSETVMRQSNLLRLGDGIAEPPGLSRKDTVYSTSLIGGLDQSFGRQRAWGNLLVRDNRYDRNAGFNNLSYTGSAGLDWSTVQRISGSVSASTNRSLSNFDYYSTAAYGNQKDEETSTSFNAAVRVGLVTQYGAELAAGHRSVRNSLEAAKSRDYDVDTASFGLRWKPRGATSLGLALRQSRGSYPRFLPDGAGGFTEDRSRENAVDLTAALQPSGASTIDARLSHSRTRYDLDEQRDFSGVTGALTWQWQPTGKLRTTTRLGRDTGQNSYAVTLFAGVPGTADYSQLVNSLRVQADYEATAKILVTTAVQAVRRRVVNSVNNPLLPDTATGKDSSTVFSLGARWMPLRSVSLGCDYTSEDRSAHNDQPAMVTVPLNDRSFGCYAQLQLQL